MSQLLPIQGKCNDTYLLEYNSKKVIYRKNKHKSIRNDLSSRITNKAYQKGIAPQIYMHNQNAVMMEYIQGSHKTTPSSKDIANLATTLKILHSIETIQTPSIYTHIPHQSAKLKSLINQTQNFKANSAICHNDLNINNILWQEDRIFFIDFDFACVNDIYFDLASVIVEFKLNQTKRDIFLKSYFPKGYNKAKLELFIELYLLFWQEWSSEFTPQLQI
jgi:thiamine kinase-like enzyme